MTEPSATRRELEERVRSFVGYALDSKNGSDADAKGAGLAFSVLGVLVAFIWGRRRGRRMSRRSKRS